MALYGRSGLDKGLQPGRDNGHGPVITISGKTERSCFYTYHSRPLNSLHRFICMGDTHLFLVPMCLPCHCLSHSCMDFYSPRRQTLTAQKACCTKRSPGWCSLASAMLTMSRIGGRSSLCRGSHARKRETFDCLSDLEPSYQPVPATMPCQDKKERKNPRRNHISKWTELGQGLQRDSVVTSKAATE